MSFAVYILLAYVWVFAVWLMSILGAKFFNPLSTWPEYWLGIICAAFAPPILALALLGFGVRAPETISVIPTFSSVSGLDAIQNSVSVVRSIKVAVLIIYCAGVVFTGSHILRGWLHLSSAVRNGVRGTLLGKDIILTNNSVPLCAFGVLHPVILVPRNLFGDLQGDTSFKDGSKAGGLLLAHETAHIRYFDPLIMVCLLILKAAFWPHPVIYDLVKRWELAAELRADNIALAGENLETRKQYGQILVTLLRRSGANNNGRTLPCPSVSLNLSNYRSAKMRVKNILTENISPRKTKRLKFQMGVLALTATLAITGAGSFGFVAAAGPAAMLVDRDAQPSVRVPPMFPANCTANAGKYAASVVVKFDVDKAGNVENIQVTKSDNPCFNQTSIDSTAKWKYEPVLHKSGVYKGKPRKRKNVQTMLKFIAAKN